MPADAPPASPAPGPPARGRYVSDSTSEEDDRASLESKDTGGAAVRSDGEGADDEDGGLDAADHASLARYRKSLGGRPPGPNQFDLVGEMTKLGRVRRSWRRRTFALDAKSRCLLYFRTEEHMLRFANEPSCTTGVLGCVLLERAAVFCPDYVARAPAAAEQACLEITAERPARRHFYLYADTKAEHLRWLAEISRCGVTVSAPRADLPWLPVVHTEPACQSVLRYGKQGYLEKRGYYNKAYKRRFFRLSLPEGGQAHALSYHARHDSLKPRGAIDLYQAHVVDADLKNPDGVEFVVKAHDRNYALRASSRAEKEEWMAVLQVMTSLREGEAAPLLKVESVYAREAAERDAARREAEALAAAEARAKAEREAAARSPGERPFRGQTRALREEERREAEEQRQRQRQARRGRQRALTVAEEHQRHAVLAGGVMTKYCRKGAPHNKAVFAVARADSARERREAKKAGGGGGPAAEAALDSEAAIEAAFDRAELERARRQEIVDVCWCDPGRDGQRRRQEAKRTVRITANTVVTRGKGTAVFAREVAEAADPARCFSIDDGVRTLDVCAVTEEVREAWVETLQREVAALREQRDEAAAATT